MKKARFIFFVSFSFLVIECSTPEKLLYDLPPNISDKRKEELMVKIKKGESLYKTHCNECHVTQKRAGDSIPDFSVKQLSTYESSFIMNDQFNHSVAKKLTSTEVEFIMIYLSCWPKNVKNIRSKK